MENKTPLHLLEKAKSFHEEANRKFSYAKGSIPEKYLAFLIKISKERFLCKETVALDDEAVKLSMGHGQDGTFVMVTEPYLGVDGRVLWARDEHRQKEKKLDISTLISGNNVIVTIVSEFLGQAMGSAQFNPNKGFRGYDLQGVESIAIGRALGFLGYGLLGSSVISEDLLTPDSEIGNPNTDGQQQSNDHRNGGGQQQSSNHRNGGGQQQSNNHRNGGGQQQSSNHRNGGGQQQSSNHRNGGGQQLE
ncbi:hypothetical protein [Paenibacillus sp. Leaf72]|uniref:hypothetical protein n=1 Tax=Paenibacillus sp. Leaf72 TaxID=1736234 RepID=UPI0006F5C64D|nr:hypothetical protein [Paenibacillus sp. Leaf72]KQN96872.1 hypothetical protein ASF12_22650 [Paenibacillus sp. Leaf72]